jgi:HEAT repeat protein
VIVALTAVYAALERADFGRDVGVESEVAALTLVELDQALLAGKKQALALGDGAANSDEPASDPEWALPEGQNEEFDAAPETKTTSSPRAQPAQPAPVNAPANPADKALKRRRPLTEEQLRRQLAWTPEVKSLTVPALTGLMQAYFEAFQVGGSVPDAVDVGPSTLLRFRGDLSSLPVRWVNRLTRRDALTLQNHSRELRLLLDLEAPNNAAGHRALPGVLEGVLRSRKVGARPKWLRPQAIPVLLQLLMHEDLPVRLMLVELLADIPGREANTALAKRAVFDLAPQVREAALRALVDRPRGDARPVFLRALRYPWAPVADHAAEALVYLADQEAVAPLVSLLQRLDPSAPFSSAGGQTYLREVVHIAHSANCLMCHPPATTRGDLVQREVPGVVLHRTADHLSVLNVNQLPAGLQGAAHQTFQSTPPGGYYSRGSGSSLGPLYVRADVTYLRQDFSISQLIGDPGTPGLLKPRIDFLVRTRRARVEEVKTKAPQAARYEQRDAIVWALEELTGKSPGSTTAAWGALFPRAEFDVKAAALADQFVAARGVRRERLLTSLREEKGPVYTQALAAAIPRLVEPGRAKAREALAQRLTRMTTQTLSEKLRDQDPEIRLAAALACASKASHANVPDLEPLRGDPDPQVAEAARLALRQLKNE